MKVKEDYWSKNAFKKRIDWYNENIKMCRRVKDEHGDSSSSQTDMIHSLIASKKMHQIAFKTHHLKTKPPALF